MNKKNILTIFFGCLLIIILLVIVYYEIKYDAEESYQDALERIDNYRKLCESANFTFEVEGILLSPEEQKGKYYSDLNYVSPKCYELKNNVKVYQDLSEMEYVDGKVGA